jgi:hypothetical protein
VAVSVIQVLEVIDVGHPTTGQHRNRSAFTLTDLNSRRSTVEASRDCQELVAHEPTLISGTSGTLPPIAELEERV